MKPFTLFILCFFSLLLLAPNWSVAQDWTEEEEAILAEFANKAFQRFGRVTLKGQEWEEMQTIHPESVALFAREVGLNSDDFVEYMGYLAIPDAAKRDQKVNAFMAAHPEFVATTQEKEAQAVKEEQERKARMNQSYSEMIQQAMADQAADDPNQSAEERAYNEALLNLAQNETVTNAMDQMMQQMQDNLDYDQLDKNQPNMMDMFKPGALKDSMARHLDEQPPMGSSLSSETELFQELYNPNPHLLAQSIQAAIAQPAQSGALYEDILIRKGQSLAGQRKYKQGIYESGNPQSIALLHDWQERVQRHRQLTLHKKGYTIPEWSKAMKETGMNAAYEKLIAAVPFSPPTKYRWQDIQKGLQAGEAAVEVIRYEDENRQAGYAFCLIRPDRPSPITVVLENGQELETLWLQKYKAIQPGYRPNPELYEAYWQPVQEHLSGIQKVYFSADGVYQVVNINLLSAPSDSTKFLIDELEVEFVFNTRYLADQSKTKLPPAKRSLALFGSPDYKMPLATDGQGVIDFRPLPYTEAEVRAIQALWPQAQLYVGQQARESSLKSLQASIVHIASHAFFHQANFLGLPKNPDLGEKTYQTNMLAYTFATDRENIDPYYRAGIALAGASTVRQPHKELLEDDGVLFASEIEHLNLHQTELVFLNACYSGSGDLAFGEGSYGLQRAFFSAGADALIMSHNEVDDAIGKDFAEYFYRYWLQEGKSKIEAFRAAQLALKADRYPIFQWGSFVLIQI